MSNNFSTAMTMSNNFSTAMTMSNNFSTAIEECKQYIIKCFDDLEQNRRSHFQRLKDDTRKQFSLASFRANEAIDRIAQPTNYQFDSTPPINRTRQTCPRFSDGDPTNWIHELHLFFSSNNIPPTTFMIYAALHLDRPASKWYRALICEHPSLSFSSFIDALMRQYGPSTFEYRSEALNNFQQISFSPALVTPKDTPLDTIENPDIVLVEVQQDEDMDIDLKQLETSLARLKEEEPEANKECRVLAAQLPEISEITSITEPVMWDKQEFVLPFLIVNPTTSPDFIVSQATGMTSKGNRHSSHSFLRSALVTIAPHNQGTSLVLVFDPGGSYNILESSYDMGIYFCCFLTQYTTSTIYVFDPGGIVTVASGSSTTNIGWISAHLGRIEEVQFDWFITSTYITLGNGTGGKIIRGRN